MGRHHEAAIRPPARWPWSVLLLAAHVATAWPASAQSPAPGPSPSPSPAVPPLPTTMTPRPVTASVEPVLDKIEEERCRKALEQGIPCFPVDVEPRPPDASVRELFGGWRPDKVPAQPQPDEWKENRPLPAPFIKLFSFDPGCLAKSVVRSFKGRNNTFYLYRIRDQHGVRVALSETKVTAETFQGDLEFLGKFDGECDAIAAYRKEDRRLRGK